MFRRHLCVLAVSLSCVVGAAPAARGAVWTPLGPEGGTVTTVAVDPLDANVVYAAADSSVWKSVDAGLSWTTLAVPTRRESHSAIAVDAVTPGTLYVTGEYDVYKSTDAGVTWTRNPTTTNPLSSLAIDPTTPQRLYAGGSDAVVVSTDGGVTWSRTLLPGASGTEVIAVAPDPLTPGTVYVAARSPYGGPTTGTGVWKSIDAGATFTPTPITATDVAALAIDPTSGAVFVGRGTFGLALQKSLDGGASWSPPIAGVFGSLAPGGIVFDPAVAGRVYSLSTGGPYRSLDGGATWTFVSTTLAGDLRTITAHPLVPGLVLAGTARGVGRSTDAGLTWDTVQDGIEAENIVGVAVDPSNTSVIYAASYDTGVYKSADAGATWQPKNVGLTSPTVYQVAIDPAAPQTILAVAGIDVHVYAPTLLARSTDGAASWSTVLDAGSGLDPRMVAFAPSAPGVVYAGGGEIASGSPIWKSIDGGATWAPTGLAEGPVIYSLAVDPTNPDIVYGAGQLPFSNDVVVKSIDGGATWTTSTVKVATGYSAPPSAIAIDPTNPQRLLVGLSADSFFRSTNGGASWTNAGLFNAGNVAFDSAGRAFVSVSLFGVWATENLGTNWINVSADLSAPNATGFAIVGDVLYAGTFGGSVQRRSIATCTNDADCSDANLCSTDTCAPANFFADLLGCVHGGISCPRAECRTTVCDQSRGCLLPVSFDGTACPDDGTSCTTDRCQSGVCQHAPDVLPSCTSPLAPGGGQLSFKSVPGGKSKLSLKIRKLPAINLASFGDPFTVGSTDYDVCVFDHSGAGGATALRLSARAPAGGTCGRRSCWKSQGLNISYADRDATPDGLVRLKLSPGPDGKANVTASGKGLNLDLPTSPLTSTITLQVRRDDSNFTCWQSTLTNVRTNTATEFKAKTE